MIHKEEKKAQPKVSKDKEARVGGLLKEEEAVRVVQEMMHDLGFPKSKAGKLLVEETIRLLYGNRYRLRAPNQTVSSLASRVETGTTACEDPGAVTLRKGV